MKKKVLVSWSGGKDSAWALYNLQKQGDVDIVGLLTTINEEYERVSIHGTRKELLKEQAKCCGLPIWPVIIPNPCSEKEYDAVMETAMRKAREAGISSIVFGDLFLEDVRNYRCLKMEGSGVEPLFPLWMRPTKELAEEIIDGGLKAVVVSLDPSYLDRSFLGREYDRRFLSDLPSSVDPCGENGEFHTFVYDAPSFSSPIPICFGEIVEREGFLYKDLIVLSTLELYRILN